MSSRRRRRTRLRSTALPTCLPTVKPIRGGPATVRAQACPAGSRLTAEFSLGGLRVTQETTLWHGAGRVEFRTHVDGSIGQDQLLRVVFEECTTFAQARRRLEGTPIARPVIFTLAGCRVGERCVIERTEQGFVTRTSATSAANDWLDTVAGWEGRVGADVVMTCSPAEAAEASRRRREALAGWNGSLEGDSFAWVAPPVLNRFTRLAIEMCAAAGTLRVAGY